MARTLLVNFWYAHPVGHAIEALRCCLGYHAADPSLRISVLLNGATPTELADCCPFVERAYPVPYTDFEGRSGDPVAALTDVPRDWDYVLDNWRAHESSQLEFGGMRAYYEAAARHLRARIAHGIVGVEPPPYVRHQQLRLELSAAARARAADELSDAVRIAVMPSGSSERSRYPSAHSWELILGALAMEFPNAVFCLVGKLASEGRTTTTIAQEEIAQLARAVRRRVDCFDRPLLDQLAFVEACDVFVAPHTGFGAAVLAVGTPWLALSGGPWHEWFFNSVPFYSVIPDTARYPCFTGAAEPPPLMEDGGPRTPSMTRARIEGDLPELLEAARMLVEKKLSYGDALARTSRACSQHTGATVRASSPSTKSTSSTSERLAP